MKNIKLKKNSKRSFIIILLSLLVIKSEAQNQTSSLTASNPIQLCETNLTWSDAAPPMLPGAKIAVIEGMPKSEGHFTIRIKFPPYYKIPPHTHPVDERTTVLKGAISIGFGDVLDTLNAKKITAGCFYLNPAGVHHFAFTSEEETEIQVSTNGPWGLDLLQKVMH